MTAAPFSTRPAPSWADRALIAASLALAALSLLLLAPHLSRAELWLYDEWYTAERVHNIVARSDWLTLYENGHPTFKKPPLQYWVTAALVLSGLPEQLALRLPSFLSAFGIMALTAHLAYRLSGKAIAVPIALTLVLCSGLFWITAASAMLDTGAAFLLTLAVTCLLHAWHKPRWWWAVALAVGAAVLQKSPAAAFAVPLVAATLRLSGSRPAPPGPHVHALWLGLFLLLVWPVAQALLHGTGTVETAVLREQLMRFRPAVQDWQRALRWVAWIAADGPLLWGGLILGALGLPFVAPSPPARGMAMLVLAFLLSFTLARGDIFDRYLVHILPVAAAAAAALLATLPYKQGLLAALALAIASGGPVKSASQAGLDHPGMTPYRPILAAFRAALQPAEHPVVCGWQRSDLALFPGALWLLGSGNQSFRRVFTPDDLSTALATEDLAPPLRGLCLAAEYDTLAAKLPLREVGRSAGWVHWTLP